MSMIARLGRRQAGQVFGDSGASEFSADLHDVQDGSGLSIFSSVIRNRLVQRDGLSPNPLPTASARLDFLMQQVKFRF